VYILGKIGEIHMTVKNILFATTLCGYCSASAALNLIIPFEDVRIVAKNYAGTLGTEVTNLSESPNLENQTETVGGIKYTCPRFFSFKTSDQKEFLIKVVNQRANREIQGAKLVRAFLPNASNVNNTNIVSFSYCELYRDGKLTPFEDVANIPPTDFAPEDWLFEIMPKVPGVTLKELIRPTGIINEEKRLNMFIKIGILLNDLNYHKNFYHGSLHLKNIIGDPITGNISLIDWDHCFFKGESKDSYTDTELVFWKTFREGILIPIMKSDPSKLESQLSNIRNLVDCLYLLLSRSLEKRCIEINRTNQLWGIINQYGKNIDDDEFDQKIGMTCRFLKPFLPFFIRNYQTSVRENKGKEYYERASALLFTIFMESNISPTRIKDMEQKLKLPQKKWHYSFLPSIELNLQNSWRGSL
jgi:hypothetical protein